MVGWPVANVAAIYILRFWLSTFYGRYTVIIIEYRLPVIRTVAQV